MPLSRTGRDDRTRALVLTLLFAVTCVTYLDRVNLSVVAETLMPALGFSKSDLAWVFNSFLLGYAIFQVPAGVLGDRTGARRVLAWSALAIGCITLLTGLLPGTPVASTTTGALLVLCSLRLLLGVAQAATFPVATHAVSLWMPPARRGFGNAAVLMGSSVGSAITGPILSWAVVHFGWRVGLYLSALPAFLLGLAWLLFRRDPPPSPARESIGPAPGATGWLTPSVFLLSLSYFSEGYLLFMFVSWLYIYLVEVRHFSLIHGGVIASLPWITAIAATPLGGLTADFLTARLGRIRASQILISVGYLLSGGLLFIAAFARARPLAVLALSLSLGALYLAESSFWTVANVLDTHRGGAVSGFMNTVGILGGVASNALVPIFVARSGWLVAFGSAAVMGLLTAALWLVLARRLRHAAPVTPNLAR